MKKTNRYINIPGAKALLTGFLILAGCTGDFDEVNTNSQSIPTVGPNEWPFLFAQAQSAAGFSAGNYQVAQNLFADQYAQYFANITTYFPSDRLVMRFDWLQATWTPIYTVALPQLKTIMDQADKNSAEYALAQIWRVWTFHRLTDYYGPVPYFKAGEVATTVPYDAQDVIYDDFFKQLTSAVEILKANTTASPFDNGDLVYGGNVSKWIRFANTLRLRLALRISKVDPVRAKTEAEAAYTSGVITSISDDAFIQKSLKGGDNNGLSVMADWNEFRMTATMESVLKGFNDPRISEFFLPAENTDTYEGLRNGLTVGELGDKSYNKDALSHVGFRWASSRKKEPGSTDRISNPDYMQTPQHIMGAAEAYFLRAEGALNNWDMGGDAEDLYNLGIENSMAQWGITDAVKIEAYKNGTSTPADPGDAFHSLPVNDLVVKFGTVEDNQREQIAMQKWLALFPDGIEAWAEYRRTDLPRLYPVAHSDNADITNTATQRLRRIPFLDVDKLTNSGAISDAVKLLNGPDKVTTPLWWDVD
jgi:hypothetical protein